MGVFTHFLVGSLDHDKDDDIIYKKTMLFLYIVVIGIGSFEHTKIVRTVPEL